MSAPPAFTTVQKRRFGDLKKQLIAACRVADVESGKVIVRDLKTLLLPTGHNIKYYEMLMHLCEALIAKEECETAETFLEPIVANTNDNTRLYQEANVLLAICKIHLVKLDEAEKCIRRAFLSKAIKDYESRKSFLKAVSERLEEEALLTAYRSRSVIKYSEGILKEVEKRCVSNASERELLEEAGRLVPNSAIDFMSNINNMARRQLVYQEQKMLPPPPGNQEYIKIGKRVLGVFSRKVWPFICAPNCKLQKTVNQVERPEYLLPLIAAELAGQGLGATMLICLLTIVIRQGWKAYCKKWESKGLMCNRYKRI